MKRQCKTGKTVIGTASIALLILFWPLAAVPEQSANTRQYTDVVPDYTLTFPRDFGAHPDFRIEWWYVTGWLQTDDNKRLGFQVTFFRSATGHAAENPSQFAPKQLIIAHAALSDPAVGQLVFEEKSAREGFDLAYAKTEDTDVKLDDWYFVRDPDGRYRTRIDDERLAMELTLAPTQKMMLQGERGFSRKGPNLEQASYYYSEPHLHVSGTVRHEDRSMTVTGHAWLDHEWSSEILDPRADGWDWVSMNLSDGSALAAFQIRAKDGSKLWAYAKLRHASGKTTIYSPEQVEFIPQRVWQSPHTGASYPVEMRILTGDKQWRVTPLFDDQELNARGTSGAVYWEGAVQIFNARQVVGEGYLELTGYEKPLDL